MVISRLNCLRNQHQPIRDRVHTEGVYMTGTCKICGSPIWRKSYRDWRKGQPDPRHA